MTGEVDAEVARNAIRALPDAGRVTEKIRRPNTFTFRVLISRPSIRTTCW